MVEELGIAGGLLIFFSNGWRKAHKHCINVLDVFFLFLRYVIETVEKKENGMKHGTELDAFKCVLRLIHSQWIRLWLVGGIKHISQAWFVSRWRIGFWNGSHWSILD